MKTEKPEYYRKFEIFTINGRRTKWFGIRSTAPSGAVVAESKAAVKEMIDAFWEVHGNGYMV